MPQPDPASNHIDLWLTWYDRIADPQLLAGYATLLNEAETAQWQRYHFADDRLRYLVTRALVRTVLSRYADTAPAAWEFENNAYGRPAVAARQAPPGLHFNISHCRGLIVLAIAHGREIGVDVENLAVRAPSLGIADHFFAPAEVAALQTIPMERRHARFFEYWTFKESYIKARGMGLSLPLDGFSFHFPCPGQVELSIDEALGDDPARWQFWQCRPAPDMLMALCAERTGHAAPSLTVRSFVPGCEAQTLAPDWLIVPPR